MAGLALALCCAGSAQAAVFTASSSTLPLGFLPEGLTIADVDGGGTPDLVAVGFGQGAGAAAVKANDGSGMFSDGAAPNPGGFGQSDARGVAVGDLDGDGHVDMGIVDPNSGYFFVYQGASGGGFSPPSAFFFAGGSGSDVKFADVNGDGRLDIVFANGAPAPDSEPDPANGHNVTLYVRSTPTGAGATLSTDDYTTTTIGLDTGDPGSVAIGDLDGDGDVDLAVTETQGSSVAVVSKTGSGTAASDYSVQTIPAGTGLRPVSIAIGDLNGDGRPDLAAADNPTAGFDGTVSIFYKNAGSGYTVAPLLLSAAGTTQTIAVAIGDLDGDGRADIVAANKTDGAGTLSVFLKDATGAGFTRTVLPDGGGPSLVTLADLTGDGKLDIVAGDAFGNRLTVFVNTTAVAAVAPVAVSGAASGVSPTGATLSGTVDPKGALTTYVFEYGTSLSFGAITPPDDAGAGSGAVPVSASLSGLSSNTTYYYRLVAMNSAGTSFGVVRSFNTGGAATPPLAVTSPASSVGATTALLAGQVDPKGRATAFTFEYGTSLSFGAITTVDVTDDYIGLESVSKGLTGLAPGTTYYYRLVATSSAGTATGGVRSFTTSAAA
jgi:hypothetical protein